MRTAGDDRAAGDVADLVRALEEQRARGGDHGRLVASRLAQALRDATLGVGVDRGGRLDEHEEVRVHEEHPHEREALALSAREAPTTLLDLGVEAVLQGVKDVLGARELDDAQDRPIVADRVRSRARLAAGR